MTASAIGMKSLFTFKPHRIILCGVSRRRNRGRSIFIFVARLGGGHQGSANSQYQQDCGNQNFFSQCTPPVGPNGMMKR